MLSVADVVTQIENDLEYSIDQGDYEGHDWEIVEGAVRYSHHSNPRQREKVESFVVRVGSQRFRVTATEEFPTNENR